MKLSHSPLLYPLCFVFCFALVVGSLSEEIFTKSLDRSKAFKVLATQIVNGNNLAADLGVGRVTRLLRRLAKNGGCQVSACFALDGSASISAEEYLVQKNFVSFLAAVVSSNETEFSAVQYGLGNIAISLLTTDVTEFLSHVETSTQAKATRTFLSAGLGFCIQDLRRSMRDYEKSIVVLGDGRSNFAEGLLSSVVSKITDETVLAVGVGFPTNPKKLLQITGGNPSNVFNVDGYEGMGEIAFGVAMAVCGN